MKEKALYIILVGCAAVLTASDFQTKYCACTQIAVVDVGQGSGLYIRTEQGKEIIIDTGETTKTLRNISQFRYPWDRSIDVMFLTHADRDHIGMSIDIARRNTVTKVIVPPVETYDAVSRVLESEQNIVFAQAGNGISIDEVYINILWPNIFDISEKDGKKIDKNENSLVLLLNIHDVKILVMGDAGTPTEESLIKEYGHILQSDILLVGHHGSRSSSSKKFVQIVSPTYSVVQVGADNRYGHPHPIVIQTLEKSGTRIFRTDIDGSIRFKINEQGISDIIVR